MITRQTSLPSSETEYFNDAIVPVIMSRRSSSSGSRVAEHRQKFQGQNYGNSPATHTTPSPVESTTSSRRSSSTSVADAGSGSHVTGVRSGEVSPRSDRIDTAGLSVAQSPRSASGTEMFPPHHHDTHRVGEVAPTRKTTGASPRPPLPRTFQLRIDDTSEAQYLAMTSDMTSSAATTAELHETDRYHHHLSDTWTWNTSSYAGGASTPTSNSSLNVPKWNSDLHHQHQHLQQQHSLHSTNFDELASSEFSRKEVRDVLARNGDTMTNSNHSNAQVSFSSVPAKVNPAAAPSSSSRDRCSDRSTATSNNDTKGLKSQQHRDRDVADGYIGFANLPNQVFRKAVKKGFDFTLIVVGESGLGKSTLINSMFMTELYSDQYPGPTPRTKRTVQVDKTEVLLKENGVQLRLTVVDTPGFGDAVDNSSCWQPVVDYIDTQFDEFLNNESRINRQSMPDTRVHCCLYFVSPNGHSLKALDVEFMKQLHTKVNVVPIIAKADTLTVDECRQFKKTIMNEIERNNIQIYEFPDSEDDDENVALKKLKERVPFAVVGSNMVMESQGRRMRGRKYPWGIVEVDNLEHNDFVALRNMLIRTNLQDLKEVTNNVHYENFRYNRLASAVSTDGSKSKLSTDKSPLLLMEEEKRDHSMKLRKMEADMEQVFEAKVKEKKLKLKESEADLQKRMEQTKKSLEQQEKDLQDRRAAFEAEKQQWEEHRKLFEVDSTSALKKKKLFNN